MISKRVVTRTKHPDNLAHGQAGRGIPAHELGDNLVTFSGFAYVPKDLERYKKSRVLCLNEETPNVFFQMAQEIRRFPFNDFSNLVPELWAFASVFATIRILFLGRENLELNQVAM